MTISDSIAPPRASATKPIQPDSAASMPYRLTVGICVVLSASAALADDMKLPTNGKEMKWGAAGGYGEAPANLNHFAWITSPTVVQVHGQGPFAMTYANPADDPSKN